MTVRVTIPGPPVPKPRPRVARGRAYTPPRYAAWERGARLLAAASLPWGVLLTVPVRVVCDFYMPIPKSWPAARRAHPGLPEGKPDVDNLAKAALDAMNGTVFVDDAQVVDLSCRKRYSSEPRTEITVAAV